MTLNEPYVKKTYVYLKSTDEIGRFSSDLFFNFPFPEKHKKVGKWKMEKGYDNPENGK